MNYKIMDRKQLEASKDVSDEVSSAIKANKYPVYHLTGKDGRDVLLFCNEPLTDLQDSIEELLEGTIYAEGYEMPESGPIQLFMNTKPITKDEPDE